MNLLLKNLSSLFLLPAVLIALSVGIFGIERASAGNDTVYLHPGDAFESYDLEVSQVYILPGASLSPLGSSYASVDIVVSVLVGDKFQFFTIDYVGFVSFGGTNLKMNDSAFPQKLIAGQYGSQVFLFANRQSLQENRPFMYIGTVGLDHSMSFELDTMDGYKVSQLDRESAWANKSNKSKKVKPIVLNLFVRP